MLGPALGGCRTRADSSPAPVAPVETTAESEVIFADVAERTGLRWVQFHGATGEYYFPEIMGGGCAFLDYDGDGDLDVYALQGALLGEADVRENAVFPYEGPWPPRNALFRNDLRHGPNEEPILSFSEVTTTAGVGDTGYGMGCAVGDYDNDGHVDLYVTNCGPNVLYHNRGDGTFEDVTAAAAADDPRWSASAAFVDVDRDGYLDLFITNYVDWSAAANIKCWTNATARDYCSPRSYDPVPDRLLHNNGDGTFTDITRQAGIDKAYGSGLGVVCADFNGDGHADIYVANDGNANQMWINRGDGTFEDRAWITGTALDEQGMAEAGMGVTAGDFDQDGDEDIFLTHLRLETNTLYRNDGTGMFVDGTTSASLDQASTMMTGFGMEWFDYDNDGLLDLFTANGGVTIVEFVAGDPFPYRMPNQLFRNLGGGRFADVSDRGGPALGIALSSRGAAFGDVDNDGDTDILVGNVNGPLQLLRNEIGNRAGWLRLRLEGRRSNRSAIGAVVTVRSGVEAPLVRRVHADGSYCSANDLRLTIGMDDDRRAELVEVRWPSGLMEAWSDLANGREHVLVEGEGSGLNQ